HEDALRDSGDFDARSSGIAEAGMIAPGWHTTTPARRCPARAASIGLASASRAARYAAAKLSPAAVVSMTGLVTGSAFTSCAAPSKRTMLAGRESFSTVSGQEMRDNKRSSLSPA